MFDFGVDYINPSLPKPCLILPGGEVNAYLLFKKIFNLSINIMPLQRLTLMLFVTNMNMIFMMPC